MSTEKPAEQGARSVVGAVKNAFSNLGYWWEEDAKKKHVLLQQMVKVSILELEVEYGFCYSKNVKRNF